MNFFKTSKYSFLELEVVYDDRNPVRIINSIIGKLSENQEVQTILLLDEIIPDSRSSGSSKEQFSLEKLDISKRNVHLLLAVNPAPYTSNFNKNFKIVPPNNKNTLVSQLYMKHRNSYHIAILLEHFKIFYGFGCLDSSQDIPLKKDNLPPGRCPVWIQRDKKVTDEFILEKIKSDHVLEHESVTLLYSINKKSVSLWCSKVRGSLTYRHAFFPVDRDFEVGKCDIFQKIHYFGSEFYEKNHYQIFNNNTTHVGTLIKTLIVLCFY